MTLLDFLLIPALLLFLPSFLRKKRGGWAQRFGKTPPLAASAKKRILLHGVSVGEINALRTLVPLLTPHLDVVISTTTDTGLARAQSLFSSTCTIVRFPLDASWAVKRFLDAVKPDAVALCELEIWPQFIRFCGERAVPVCIINGRLSERSFRGYRFFRPLLTKMFRSLEFASVQDTDYAARFQYMGVEPARCHITGSMKWDAISLSGNAELEADAVRLASELGINLSRPLIVAGSTGPGEEELLHQVVPPNVQLLCAPRKPERFDEAAAALPGCVRRSQKIARPCSRFLLDSIGELRNAYALADLVVIGRSFGRQFGSDPIEPIALGKPVVIGPAHGDFKVIVDQFAAADAIVVATRESLRTSLERLLLSKEAREALAANGLVCIRKNQGAAARNAELIMAMMHRHRA